MYQLSLKRSTCAELWHGPPVASPRDSSDRGAPGEAIRWAIRWEKNLRTWEQYIYIYIHQQYIYILNIYIYWTNLNNGILLELISYLISHILETLLSEPAVTCQSLSRHVDIWRPPKIIQNQHNVSPNAKFHRPPYLSTLEILRSMSCSTWEWCALNCACSSCDANSTHPGSIGYRSPLFWGMSCGSSHFLWVLNLFEPHHRITRVFLTQSVELTTTSHSEHRAPCSSGTPRRPALHAETPLAPEALGSKTLGQSMKQT